MELFRSKDYVVRAQFPKINERWSIVCFHHLQDKCSLDGYLFGENICKDMGWNFIGFKSARNDWWQTPGIEDALDAVCRYTDGWFLTGYGASMGGYGVINFSERLRLKRVVAIAPQYSIQSSKIPFDDRWKKFENEIHFTNDRIDMVKPINDGALIVDPWSLDSLHAERIFARHAIRRIPLNFTGHHPLMGLYEMGLIKTWISEFLHGRYDEIGFRRSFRRARSGIRRPWQNVESLAHIKGKKALAKIANERARALPVKLND